MATQGQIVIQAVRQVFPKDTHPVVPPTTSWNDEQKRKVNGLVFMAFKAGETTKNSGGTSDEALLKYIPGLVNNWVRKSKELNGGVDYQPKNPGSRSGAGDETLKNLRLLLASVTDEDARHAVQQEIDKRIAELKPTIDVSKLPESLRHLVK